MKSLLLAFFCMASVAMAQTGPHIEPGPVVMLDQGTNEVVDALLMANPADLKVFTDSGNVTKEVSRQNLRPGLSVFEFVRKRCMLGGITGGQCFGGAQLRVMVEEIRLGSMVTIQATSSVTLIK